MIFSKNQTFSEAQAITATAAATNIIDLGAAGTPYGAARALNKDVGAGNEVPLLIQVVETFNNLTSLTIAVVTDDNTAISSGTTIYSIVVPLASLVVGFQLPVRILMRGTERALAMSYTVTGTAPSTGKITAGIVDGIQSNLTGA